MDLKRHNSYAKVESNGRIAKNYQVEPENHFEKPISTIRNSTPRIPQFMRSAVRGRLSIIKQSPYLQEEVSNKQSKLGTVITSGIKSVINNLRDITLCEICETDIKKPKSKELEVFMCNCEHKYNFCESCLHHYVIHKIKTFQEVPCPHDGCPVVLDISTFFFKNLPIDVQKEFKKITQFYMVSKDSNIRICPKQHCQGIIKYTLGNTMMCDHCKTEFCGKCLLGVHEGQCDRHEVAFFEKNLHYQQCKKCKFVIQKNQGCNHMTCRCGYQFCYICGSDWDQKHFGDHNENGQLVPNAQIYQMAMLIEIELDPPHIDQNEERGCRQICCSVLKAPIKLILFLLYGVIALVMITSGPVLIALAMLVVTLLAGMFGFSCELIDRMEGVMCLLGILFFPVTMIAGVIVAFPLLFCPIVSLVCEAYSSMLSHMAECICNL